MLEFANKMFFQNQLSLLYNVSYRRTGCRLTGFDKKKLWGITVNMLNGWLGNN
jgi:hypothetical protein